MTDKSEEILKHTHETLQSAKNMKARELETPLTNPLSPEAREDALKVAREIWKEAMRILGGNEHAVRRDPAGKKGNLIISGESEVEKTIFQGADLGMTRYTYEDDPANDRRDITQELWHFYPKHVLKTTRHSAETYSAHGPLESPKQLAPKGLATQKTEADKEELSKLLDDLKSSQNLDIT